MKTTSGSETSIIYLIYFHLTILYAYYLYLLRSLVIGRPQPQEKYSRDLNMLTLASTLAMTFLFSIFKVYTKNTSLPSIFLILLMLSTSLPMVYRLSLKVGLAKGLKTGNIRYKHILFYGFILTALLIMAILEKELLVKSTIPIIVSYIILPFYIWVAVVDSRQKRRDIEDEDKQTS